MVAAKSLLYRVVFTERAFSQVRDADVWWRENRRSAADAIGEELDRVVALLASQPRVGARAKSERLPGVRRILLSRVRYFVYYRVLEQEGAVEILAFWHGRRGSVPHV